MRLPEKLLNKLGYEKAQKKTAGFLSTEIQSDPQESVESEKVSGYKNFIDAFNRLPWLYAGSVALAMAMSKPELKLYKGRGAEKHEITDEEPLRLLQKPNPFMSHIELLQITVINLLITGNHFWNLVGTNEGNPVISPENPPVEIWWVKPEQIDIISHPTDYISQYLFRSSSGKTKNLDPSEIIHFKRANPDSYFRGTGAMPAGENAAILEFDATTYNKKFLENDGTPDGNYHFPDKPSRKQLKEFRDWHDRRHKGAKNAGRFGVTYGGIEYKETGKSPKDVQFVEMKKMNREETLATLGIPPSIVGLLEYANYSNMEVQQKKFWEDTVIPIATIIASKLTAQLAPLYDPEYYFEFDYSNISALQADEEKKSKVVQNVVTAGVMSRNEARERFYGLPPREGLDAIYLPMNLIPIIGSDKESPQAGTGKAKSLPSRQDDRKPTYWEDKTRKKILWENYVKRIESKEKPFIPLAEKYQERQGEEIVKRLKKYEKIADIAPEALLNVDEEAEKYKDTFLAWCKETVQQAGESGRLNARGYLYSLDGREILTKDEDDFLVTPEIEEELMNMVFYSGTEVNQTTIAQIDRTLRRAIKEEWTVEQFTQAIDAQIDDFKVWKARLWARTETTKFENWGQLEGYRQDEFIDRKLWLSAFGDTSRDEHMAADGQERLLDEDFDVGGEQLRYPGDPQGSAGNICNCLCTTAPVVMDI